MGTVAAKRYQYELEAKISQAFIKAHQDAANEFGMYSLVAHLEVKRALVAAGLHPEDKIVRTAASVAVLATLRSVQGVLFPEPTGLAALRYKLNLFLARFRKG